MNNTVFNPFQGPPIERVIYTTKSQSEIWTDCLIGGEDANKAYIISTCLEIKGLLDTLAIEKAIRTVIQRHESLRAVFSSDGIFMTIFKDIDLDITFQDLSTVAVHEKETRLQTYLKKEVETNFDLINGPLIKFGIIKLSDLDHQLVITTHHIICDGWSMSIVLQDLSTLYSSYVKKTNPILPTPINFSNYADELHSLMESSEYKKVEDFWINLYQQPIPTVDLPTDYIRPSLRTYKSNRINFQLKNTLIENLKLTAAKSGCSFVSTLISAFEIFLYQLTGQNDLALGLPTSGQSSIGMIQLVGHCVNLLPLRTNINPNISFLDYLKIRKNQIFDAYEHDQISFGQLLQKLPIARDPSRIPLVPVVINFETNPEEGVEFERLTTTLKNNVKLCETFEIFLNIVISRNEVRLEWSYKTDLFKSSTIENMMVSFEILLENLIANASANISSILNKTLSAEYNILNQTQRSYSIEALHNLILAKALDKEVSKRDAIIFKDTSIKYGNLGEKINQLAHFLVNQGVKSGDIIGVSLPRCQELPIILLAIMQCGAIYLPLDPTYPTSRLEFMLADSEAKLLITNKNLFASFPIEVPKVFLEDATKWIVYFPSTPLNLQVEPTSACYVLYTSGSTGKPKGVAVSHKNLVNFLFSMAEKPGISETDKLLSITTISFDIAGLELFLPLLTGATLVIADDTTARDGRLLHELIIKEHISILQATPTTWQMLLDSGWKTPIQLKALCGGEALPLNLAQELISKCQSLWNMYGPTETTIWSSIKQVLPSDTLITIGKPIANTQMYLLNEQGQLVPPGTIGEICIGGDGVALGYWKRPELTTEKFIPNSFNSATIYKTGDLGKLLPNGDIQCLGRIDQQVKIRGHRIELGEIEQALSRLNNIHMAVVLADSDILTAYVVPTEQLNEDCATTVINIWKSTLKTELPTHLIPSSFNLLDRFPTTLNDKIDRKALQELNGINSNSSLSYTGPRTKAEKIIADIWQNSLGIDKIDIYSNFFELGGHSLIAVKVMRQIEEKTGKRLPLSALFEYSTIEKLAELLNLDKEVSTECLVPINPTGNKTPIFFIHGAGLNVLIFNDLAKSLDKDQPAYALEGTKINQINSPLNTVENIAAYYIETMIKVNPEGPYAIAGYSFGGIIAYEMGRQLMAKGKKISMLSILDTNVSPEYYYASSLGKKLAKFNVKSKRRFTYFKEMLFSWEKMMYHINRKKHFIQEYYLTKPTFPTLEDELNFKQYLISNARVSMIEDRYHMVPSHLKIDLFKAKNNNGFLNDREYLGWKKIALGGVNMHHIPGNHSNIFKQPHVVEFANILQSVMDERHANM